VLYQAYQWCWTALDWLFPPACGGCDTPGTRWCQECQSKVRQILPPYCRVCGQKDRLRGELCERCQENLPRYAAVRSWGIFEGPVRNALHHLKYRRNVALGESLSRPLIAMAQTLGWDLNLVTPVPLGAARMKERGYNQAALLARPLALRLDLAYQPAALRRVRETQSQVNLNRAERVKNVAGAFQADHRLVSGKHVLVVDDVTTSGSTLDACAEALLCAGAKKVYGLTLARAE